MTQKTYIVEKWIILDGSGDSYRYSRDENIRNAIIRYCDRHNIFIQNKDDIDWREFKNTIHITCYYTD